MLILGIETTCDETGVAIVEDGRKILANVVASSAELQQKYKGVVPEIAAREQIKIIIPCLGEALSKGRKVDAIAVAYGPGLIGSLLVGVETAKTLAAVWNKPLIPVNHLLGHVYANWLKPKSKVKNQKLKVPEFPLVALIVSGGHTDLILMTGHGKYQWLGGTLDDAAGEAFDKVARALGLGYPGGPEIERSAQNSKPQIPNSKSTKSNIKLPRPMIDSKDFDFSFSGLKTAVSNLVMSSGFIVNRRAEVASEFQKSIVEVLVTKTIRAAKKYAVKTIVVGGGVAANETLRKQLTVHGSRLKINVFFPSKELSIDNGAMIAAAAFYNYQPLEVGRVTADPGLYL